MSDSASPDPYTPPAASKPVNLPPAGWYPDGRYWDGAAWTDEVWPETFLPLPGWRIPYGEDETWYWDGRNYKTLPQQEAWKDITKRLRSPREVFEHPKVQSTIRRLAAHITGLAGNPWLDGEGLAKAIGPDILHLSKTLAQHVTPRKFFDADWFTHDLERTIRTALADLIEAQYERRKMDLRSHDPIARAKHTSFTPGGPAPEAMKYGVSHEGAEYLVAEWMVYLGESDSHVTRFSGDGGIDVESSHYVTQVKNYSRNRSVGSNDIRELQGIATLSGRRPLFFTSGKYPSGGVEFADKVGMALFRYDALAGSLVGANGLGLMLLRTGL